jgi:hypothetical protein
VHASERFGAIIFFNDIDSESWWRVGALIKKQPCYFARNLYCYRWEVDIIISMFNGGEMGLLTGK